MMCDPAMGLHACCWALYGVCGGGGSNSDATAPDYNDQTCYRLIQCVTNVIGYG